MARHSLGNGQVFYSIKTYLKSGTELETVKIRAATLGLTLSTYVRDLIIRDLATVSRIHEGTMEYKPFDANPAPELPPSFNPNKPFFTPEELEAAKTEVEDKEEEIRKLLEGI